MAMTAISVIMTVFVLNLHFRGPNDNPVPAWLVKLCGLARKSKEQRRNSLRNAITNSTKQCQTCNLSLKSAIERIAQDLRDGFEDIGRHRRAKEPHMRNSIKTSRTNSESAHDGYNSCIYEPPSSTDNDVNVRSRSVQSDILQALKQMMMHYELDDNTEDIMYEWRQLAMLVDKILFWIFLMGTSLATVIILVVAPILKIFD